MTPHDIEPTWVAFANCGNPYFFCRKTREHKDLVRKEMRYIRPRGGDVVLLEGIQVQQAIDKMMRHWPKTNPCLSLDSVMFRIAPHTEQAA